MTTNYKLHSSKGGIDNIRQLKISEILWKLVSKASNNNSLIHEYIITIIKNDLIKRKMIKKSDRKNISFKNPKIK